MPRKVLSRVAVPKCGGRIHGSGRCHANEYKQRILWKSNARRARAAWGVLPKPAMDMLKRLSEMYSLDVSAGELRFLGNRWYVTHSGLLQIARRNRCAGIGTAVQERLSNPAGRRWVFRATVYKSCGSEGFVGYGDADPSNISPLVRGSEMRIAETRAVNRALRKAYGIGLCSVEELGYFSSRAEPASGPEPAQPHSNGNDFGNGHVRLRDRLCLLIRQHQLDPTLVKRYASDFCGAPELRDASRDRVESFIAHLAEWATKDRDGLVCKLNSYAQAEEVRR